MTDLKNLNHVVSDPVDHDKARTRNDEFAGVGEMLTDSTGIGMRRKLSFNAFAYLLDNVKRRDGIVFGNVIFDVDNLRQGGVSPTNTHRSLGAALVFVEHAV